MILNDFLMLPAMASAMGIFIGFLQVVFLLLCILLVLLILVQRPREQGLGAALGGDMAENFMGAGASDALAKFTIWLGTGFFVLSLAIALIHANYQEDRNAGVLGDVTEEVSTDIPEPETAAEAGVLTQDTPLTVGGEPTGDAQSINPAVEPTADATETTEELIATEAPEPGTTGEPLTVDGTAEGADEPAEADAAALAPTDDAAAEPAREEEATEAVAETTDEETEAASNVFDEADPAAEAATPDAESESGEDQNQ
jgi:preprotein translocase subunit SecG